MKGILRQRPADQARRPARRHRAAALWLASDDVTFVNGHALVVDGGLTGGRSWSVAFRRAALRQALGSRRVALTKDNRPARGPIAMSSRRTVTEGGAGVRREAGGPGAPHGEPSSPLRASGSASEPPTIRTGRRPNPLGGWGARASRARSDLRRQASHAGAPGPPAPPAPAPPGVSAPAPALPRSKRLIVLARPPAAPTESSAAPHRTKSAAPPAKNPRPASAGSCRAPPPADAPPPPAGC